MSAWSHLPNAAHIDRILESLKTHSEIWVAALNAALDAAWNAALDAAWNAARGAALDAAWNAARNAALDAARGAALDAAWNAARVAALDAARGAVVALIAWDDSAQFLDMTGDELIVWIRLSNNPAAILMLPAVKALEQIAACLDTGSKSAYNHSHALI